MVSPCVLGKVVGPTLGFVSTKFNSEPKVEQFCVSSNIKANVVCFEITVDDTVDVISKGERKVCEIDLLKRKKQTPSIHVLTSNRGGTEWHSLHRKRQSVYEPKTSFLVSVESQTA